MASNGERVTEIQSVDDSAIVAFCEHDCNSSTTRSSSGTSNILFTGHDNGVIQMWDLATAGKKQQINSIWKKFICGLFFTCETIVLYAKHHGETNVRD